MSRFSHFIENYSKDRSNSENRSNQKNHSNLDNVIFDRDQVARNSHVEHANENSKFSHHFRRSFIEISIFFFHFLSFNTLCLVLCNDHIRSI